MLRVALRPRYLGLLALMVVATLACGLLASWQWDRAHHAITDTVDGPEQLGDIRDVVGVGGAVTNEIVGDTVTATGRYDAAEQVIVPGRIIDGSDAVIVVAALQVALEDGTVARLPVARGWVEASALTGPDGELDPELAPPVPSGEVEIAGRLEASESASDGVSGGIVGEIATPLLVNEWGAPMYAGYVALVDPADGLQPLPAAESAFTRGLDWQNIGYATQWIMFGTFALYLWWRSVRTAHLDELAAHREAMEELFESSTPNSTSDPSPEPAPTAEPATAGSASAPAASAHAGPTPDKDV